MCARDSNLQAADSDAAKQRPADLMSRAAQRKFVDDYGLCGCDGVIVDYNKDIEFYSQYVYEYEKAPTHGRHRTTRGASESSVGFCMPRQWVGSEPPIAQMKRTVHCSSVHHRSSK